MVSSGGLGDGGVAGAFVSFDFSGGLTGGGGGAFCFISNRLAS